MDKCTLFMMLIVASPKNVLSQSREARPNMLWMHVESTDGRLYNPSSPVPIPNIRAVQKSGVNFANAYANIPICCPSRASVWTGRQPHRLNHTFNGIDVIGAISNYEGLGVENSYWDTRKMNDLLLDAGYNVQIGGKRDWLSGSHSLTTMVDSWSIYARFPYDIPKDTGLHFWGDCGGNLSVLPGNESAHKSDWKIVTSQTKWLREYAHNASSISKSDEIAPFFMYGGFVIVHPPYRTNEKYLARIDQKRIEIPQWGDITKLHPCDLGVSMKKGCAVSNKWNAPTPEHPKGTGFIDTDEHKRGVIAGYYAMIAEYDDMVGEYVRTLKDTGLYDNTVIILSSDHGDMQMQHRQFYKMSAYEASTRVPIVVGGGVPGFITQKGINVETLVSLVDILPTVLQIAKYDKYKSDSVDKLDLDGTSLVPLLKQGDAASATHPDFIVSQHHGENMVMSWYMIRRGEMKYIAWGTGKEHPPQLFNLTADPNEVHNLAVQDPAKYKNLLVELDTLLRENIDYPAVSMSIAKYNIEMAKWWMQDEPAWRLILNGTANSTNHGGPQSCLAPQKAGPGHNQAPVDWFCQGGSDWSEVWQTNNSGFLAAWMDWVTSEPKIVPCPSTLTYE